MRLPVVGGNDSCIDVETAKQMLAVCMESGINYFANQRDQRFGW